MRKSFILGLALVVSISFAVAQTGNQPDERNYEENTSPSGDAPENTSDAANSTDDSSASSRSYCDKTLPEESSSVAKKVINTIFCGVGNMGNALLGLLG